MITPETRAEICRLVKVEHFSITKTAKMLGVHHSTVRRALDLEGRVPHITRIRSSALDTFTQLIHSKLEEYPNITATALGQILKDRGYQGSEQMLRLKLAQIRGTRPKKAYLPITAYAGDEGQVDWAHFGALTVGKTQRKLSCFVMVLSYSRAVYARFFFDQTLDSFLSGHVKAFSFFSGVPRTIRYDNLRAAVAERYGSTIRYNQQLVELSGYYCFKVSACNPYSGHEKGRVERTIRYIREGFFVGREFRDIAAANAALSQWVGATANKRAWPEDRRLSVETVFSQERPKLIALPQEPFFVSLKRPVRSGKIPFIRFDKNDYSIPYQLCGKPLSLSANEDSITIADGTEVIATHKRSYSGGEKIIENEHFSGLVASRPGAETVAARSQLVQLLPEVESLFRLMVERGVGLGAACAKIYELLRTYGTPIVTEAVKQALSRSHAEAHYLAMVCENLSRKQKTKPALPMDLPADLPGADLVVTPHDPSTYDKLID